ncbi:hypothetical protein D3C81_1498210 [compost metagenome]
MNSNTALWYAALPGCVTKIGMAEAVASLPALARISALTSLMVWGVALGMASWMALSSAASSPTLAFRSCFCRAMSSNDWRRISSLSRSNILFCSLASALSPYFSLPRAVAFWT